MRTQSKYKWQYRTTYVEHAKGNLLAHSAGVGVARREEAVVGNLETGRLSTSLADIKDVGLIAEPREISAQLFDHVRLAARGKSDLGCGAFSTVGMAESAVST